MVVAGDEDEAEGEDDDERGEDEEQAVHQVHVRLIQGQAEDELHHRVDQQTEESDQDAEERVHEQASISTRNSHLLVHPGSSTRLAVVVLLVVSSVRHRRLVVSTAGTMSGIVPLVNQSSGRQTTRRHAARVPIMMMVVMVRMVMVRFMLTCDRIDGIDGFGVFQQSLVEGVNGPDGLGQRGGEEVEDDGVEGEDQNQDEGHD